MAVYEIDAEPTARQLWVSSDPSVTFLRDRHAVDAHRWVRQPDGDLFTWTQVLARYGSVSDVDPYRGAWTSDLGWLDSGGGRSANPAA